MSITDELREFAASEASDYDDWVDGIRAIADRIDAAHRSALEKLAAQVDRLEPEDRAEPENGVNWKEEARTWERYCKELITERDERYIPLPVDADGEYIHMGDVMDTEHFGTVEVEGFVHNAIAFYNYSGQPAYICTSPANLCHRHHHAPTVEDVLREFADRVCNSGHQWGLDAADTIAEYAAKLRLAGEGE